MIGQTISHYKIIDKVGEGGMGVVYKAQDLNLDRFVALKFLPERLSNSEQDRARFLQEAKAASALNHPNICTIHGIEEHDKQMFIVMELVEGQTLNEKKSTISFKQAIDIGIQLAEGLAVAHEKGIVHRDIKPDNIMIRKDGIAQIMDFGLAKLRGVSRLTKEGSTVGTAGYMSPEQVQGQDADHRSDIFSLGVLLYELFTGQLPFRGVHETALMYEIVNVDPPPMSSIKPDISPELDAIILECMEKDPNERTQSVKQVAVDLNRFKRTSSRERMSRIMPAHRIQDSNTKPLTNLTRDKIKLKQFYVQTFIAVFIFASALLLGKLIFGIDGDSKDLIKFEVSLPPGEELGKSLDISPDGKQVAYVSYDRKGSQIYIRNMSDIETNPISGTEGANFVFFSPHGDWIGFEVNGSLKKISVHGGSPITICVVDNLRGADWGDDNFIIFSPGTNSGLWRVSADGGTPQQISRPDSSSGQISHRYPEILPGSKAVLYTVKSSSITKFSDAKIAVQRLDANEMKVLIEGGSFVKYIPTGHLLYGQGGSIYAVAFDPNRLELKGSPVRVLDGGMFVEGFGSMTMAVSSTGTLVYTPGGPLPQDSGTVVLYDRKGNGQLLVDAPARYASIAISPDRERLVFYMVAANDDIWLYDIRRQLRTRFTFAGGNNWYPIWTLDGKHIVYTAERGGPPNLFWKPTDGSGSEERLASGAYIQVATSWSPDGKLLAYHQGNASGNSDIWILPMNGDKNPTPFLQTKFDEDFASFSPDGRWIAYSTNESGIPEIFAVSYPKGDARVQISIGGGIFPAWVKGKAGEEIIYYNFSDKKMMRVPITFTPDIHPGRAEILFALPDYPQWRPDVSPDGEHIAMAFAGKQATLTKLDFVVNWFEELKKQLVVK